MSAPERKFLQYYAKASGLAIFKILLVYGGYELGKKLEAHYPIHPWGVLGGIFGGVFIGLSLIVYIGLKK